MIGRLTRYSNEGKINKLTYTSGKIYLLVNLAMNDIASQAFHKGSRVDVCSSWEIDICMCTGPLPCHSTVRALRTAQDEVSRTLTEQLHFDDSDRGEVHVL